MSRGLRRGDVVEVRSPAEILATLDATGSLDGLPFMPEMVARCHQRFTVERRAERICDTVHYTGTRRLADAVFLGDLRCDGSGHAGCQAECRILWKEAWLKTVGPVSPPAKEASTEERAALLARVQTGTTKRLQVDGKDERRFRCQATELPGCTEHVKLWNPAGYLREVTSGNVGLGHFAQVMSRAVVQEPMRKLGLIDEVHVRGEAKKGESFEQLDLRPGEWVRVRSREEIARTLNAEGRNKGLWFDREMLPYCGKVFRVRQRIHTFVNDQDGRLIELKNEAITLEGVVCSGNYSLRRWFCAREIYPYWRECWLERVAAPAEAGEVAQRHPPGESQGEAGDAAR